MAIFSLAAVLAVALGLLWALAVLSYARILLSPPRMTDGKAAYRLRRVSPQDLGMPCERLQFEVEKGLKIAAWMIPAEGATKLAVLVHGYADAKVGALAWAPLFRDLGYHLLLPDLRAHGESGGTSTTGGVREADDLDAVLNQLRAQYPSRCTRVVLFGASLGAAAVALVATRRTDLQAVVLDSPVANFAEGALGHSQLMALPGQAVVGPAMQLAAWWTGVQFGDAAIEHTLPDLKCPALLVLPADDAFVTGDARRRLSAAFESHKKGHPAAAIWTPPVPHLLAVTYEEAEYAQKLGQFVGNWHS